MSFKGKKAVVTGGAGFIGSSLVRLLASEGADVHVIDNLVNGKSENLSEVHCQLHELDIRNSESVEAVISGSDYVFHLACLGVRHSIHSPFENHEVNATATLSLLDLSRKHDVGRFIYTSTSEVYGTAQTVPMDETHPTFPKTVYGGSKLAGESYTRAFWETYQYPTTVVRPFNAFGPRSHHEGDSGEVIPKFMLRTMAGKPMVIFGDGSQTRDFTYVDDTARGLAMSATSEKCIGETLNIGNGNEITIRELAEQISVLFGRNAAEIDFQEDRPGDVLRLYANTNKAQEITGYHPQTPLSDGLAKLRTWYEEQGKDPEELLSEEKVFNWIKEREAN
ncbi:MAG: GDP-mannose 4,6-dehydratase [Pseudomonadota bacterium]